MYINNPVLTLVKNPINTWGLTNNDLITSYNKCLQDSRFNFLGYKSNLSDFICSEPAQDILINSKYLNLYSEISNYSSITENPFVKLSKYAYTHDLILSVMPDHTMQVFLNNLSNVLEIAPINIKLTFIDTNITLLAHRDSDYFNKITYLHPSMKQIKDAMITDSALNWNLIGQESLFRIVNGGSIYFNKGQGELVFFNPCKYKHGTSNNVKRLTLSVRFFNMNFNDVWQRINQKLTILAVDPIK